MSFQRIKVHKKDIIHFYEPGLLISRHVVGVNFLEHFGLMDRIINGEVWVYDFQPNKGGFGFEVEGRIVHKKVKDFLEDRNEILIYHNDIVDNKKLRRKVLHILKFLHENNIPIIFNLLNNNCELIITKLFYGENAWSSQTIAAIILSVLIIILVLIVFYYILRKLMKED